MAEQVDPKRDSFNLAIVRKSDGKILGGVSAVRDPASGVLRDGPRDTVFFELNRDGVK